MRKPITNWYDNECKQKWEEIFSCRKNLCACVQDCITRKGVISLYMDDTPDQRKAMEDFADTQHKMRNLIGHYDTLVAEYTRWFHVYHKLLNECQDWTPDRLQKSHEIVEIAYRNYFRE